MNTAMNLFHKHAEFLVCRQSERLFASEGRAYELNVQYGIYVGFRERILIAHLDWLLFLKSSVFRFGPLQSSLAHV
jgi:hypothetical protein